MMPQRERRPAALRDPVLAVAAAIVTPACVVIATYFLTAGHNAPGGGFIAGLVAGAGLAVQALDGGPERVRATIRFSPLGYLGTGLVLAAATAILPLLWGEALLTSGKVTISLGPLGKLKPTSTLAFDSGVFLVVVGVVAAMLILLVPTRTGERVGATEEQG
ncbi:MAG: MnhB domain-containing protein [Phycisphaerales bacterium]|nr:MnhB domain-containing protein [Phycisphaerales bacterium]